MQAAGVIDAGKLLDLRKAIDSVLGVEELKQQVGKTAPQETSESQTAADQQERRAL